MSGQLKFTQTDLTRFPIINYYIKFLCQPVRFRRRSRLNYLTGMRIKLRQLKMKAKLAVGQRRVVGLSLRNDPLNRFKRLRKSEMYSRRNKDGRQSAPLFGIITYIGPASKKDKFRLVKIFLRTKAVWLTVNLAWGSRTISGLTTVRPRGLNLGRSVKSKRKNLARHTINIF